MGNRTGREEIREWISSTMNMFPGSEMPIFPCEWYAIDDEKGWVIARILNRMKDPGDGSIHESPVITVLKYAGEGKWSYEEDAYNPMNFLVMVQEYVNARAQARHAVRRRPHIRQEHELATGLSASSRRRSRRGRAVRVHVQ